MSKWVVASLFVGLSTVTDAVTEQIGFRLSSGTNGVTNSRVRGLTINVERWWGQPLTPWVVIGTLAAVAYGLIRWRRSKGEIGSIMVCCAIVAVPAMAWYLVLNNHSQIHPQLVYRSLPIAFGAVAALAYAASRGPIHHATRLEGQTDAIVADGHVVDGNDPVDPHDPEPEAERIP